MCSIVWSMIVLHGRTQLPTKPNPVHFLWALLFLKGYDTTAKNAAMADCDEKTFRKWCWFYVEAIADLDVDVVSCCVVLAVVPSSTPNYCFSFIQIKWQNRFKDDTGDTALVYVDGKDFACNQVLRLRRSERRKWYTHKYNHFGIKYEIATCIKTGDVVHYYGPVRAAIHDLTLFRSFLRKKLGHGERVLADRGYRGDRLVCTLYNSNDAQHARSIKLIGARHETMNGRLCFFGAMQQEWRHQLCKHHLAFRSCLVLVQLNHQHNRPVFQCFGYIDPHIPGVKQDWDYDSDVSDEDSDSS